MSQEIATGLLAEETENARAGREARKGQADHPPIVENVDGPVVLFPNDEPEDMRPAPERIASLFDEMPGRRDVLLALLDSCQVRRSDEGVSDIVADVQRENRSVFSAITLCRMLEKAGALAHVREDGEPFNEDELGYETFVEDGVEYIRAAQPPASFWETTADGTAYLAADDPAQRVRELFGREDDYLPVYKYLLVRCLDGCGVKELEATVDEHPLTQEPRLYVQHFLKQLEDAGALKWDGAWRTTGCGASALAELDSVESI